MATPIKNSTQLGLFPLIMIAIVSVDSLRNLPIGAQYGFSLVTFYLIAGITFFLPLAWVTAKLAAKYPNTGGSYIWIEHAFGGSIGYLSIWLQWIYNIIWYPTIFSFIASTLASLFFPDLATNKTYILLASLGFFWALSVLHTFGLRTSSWISTLGSLIGTLFPMFLIMGLALYTLLTDHHSATPFSWHALIPNEKNLHNLGFFSNILFSLLGLDIIAMHAGNVTQPQKTYPRAIIISSILILFTLTFSSLSLCIIMPSENIMIMSGLMDVFHEFFNFYHIKGAATVIGFCIVMGGIAIASSWMIGLARGLHTAICSTNAPSWMQSKNKNNMPANVLFLQAIVYSVLLGAYLLFDNVNSSYWFLSALTAQFALVYYIILFTAAIKLLRRESKSLLNVVLPSMACVICIIGIIVGFLPPEQIPFGSAFHYGLLMGTSFVVIGLIPALIIRSAKKSSDSRRVD